ncbi:copper resistance protein CopC [Mycobacterium sp. OTB74]|uniref:copper resistance CopC/CopD family protein n=1 Tax=Mycobacterium sp. OTB74 TaxID=1853452 RepID=UPI00247626F3|nr:copper resistance protein CopC [Mycobacterium sp. OTB74]MDH6245956.1 copper transport protein [Mycobacterium sp. OTB74]
MKFSAALLGVLFALLALPTLIAAPAHAHAVLVASDPVDGSNLPVSPARVTLTFDEPVRMVPGAVQVVSGNGAHVDLGAHLQSGGAVVELTLPPSLPRGSYTAMWRLISADGHEVAGSVNFGVGQDPNAPPLTRDHQVEAFAVSSAAIRCTWYAGLVLGIGVPLICRALWVWTLTLRRTRVLAGTGWLLLGIAVLASFADIGPSTMLTAQAVFVPALAATGVLMLRRPSTPPALFAAAATAVTIGVAARGHAAVGPNPWPAIAATGAHLLAMALWLGGLCVLAVVVLPAKRTDGLDRWSLTAFGCVAVVILSGEYQAWRQISPIESLWSTGYGMALCAKVFLVAVMLAVALLGRRPLTTDRLRRTVPLEAALGVLVLIMTMVLTGEPPARTTYGPALTATADLPGGRQAQVHLATTRRGAIPIDVTLGTAATSVQGTLSSAQIASLPVRFTAGPDGQWHSTYATAPLPGLWTLRLTVQFSANDAAVTSVPFRTW